MNLSEYSWKTSWGISVCVSKWNGDEFAYKPHMWLFLRFIAALRQFCLSLSLLTIQSSVWWPLSPQSMHLVSYPVWMLDCIFWTESFRAKEIKIVSRCHWKCSALNFWVNDWREGHFFNSFHLRVTMSGFVDSWFCFICRVVFKISIRLVHSGWSKCGKSCVVIASLFCKKYSTC